jgi:hypothetical protein
MGERRNVYKILVENPEGIKPLGRTNHRWDYNIKIDFEEVGWEGMD